MWEKKTHLKTLKMHFFTLTQTLQTNAINYGNFAHFLSTEDNCENCIFWSEIGRPSDRVR